jgi:ABC-type dipeptide/oligopeptide/nickel transport system ATPase component
MTDTLGYQISSGRFTENKQKYTYKLIVSFDKDKIDLEKLQKVQENSEPLIENPEIVH